MVRFVVALLMVAVATCVACGKEPSFKVYHAEPRLELSPSVPEMTAAEFEQYAQWRNARQYREAERRHDEYVKERGPLTTIEMTTGTMSATNRARLDVGQSPNARITSRSNDTSQYESQRWTQTYRDLNDGGGGAITIINPYCHGYFK
jgi:hypothetical protein